MMYNKTPRNSIGPIGLMWVVVFALKLMEVIAWHWLIVIFFPVLVVLGIVLTIAVFCFFGACIMSLWETCTTADKLQKNRKEAH